MVRSIGALTKPARDASAPTIHRPDDFSMAQVKPLPAEIAVYCRPPSTAMGLVETLLVVEFPSCPKLSAPQHHAPPLVSSAQA